MNNLNDFLLAHTSKIHLPKTVIFENKNGKLRTAPTLTKSNNITKRNKQPVIELKDDAHSNFITIYPKGLTKHIKDIENEEKDITDFQIPRLRDKINDLQETLKKVRKTKANLIKRNQIEKEIAVLQDKFDTYWERRRTIINEIRKWY